MERSGLPTRGRSSGSGELLGANRPLVSAIRTPALRAARMRLGQISVYSSTSRSGRSAAMARRVAPGRSYGA